MLANGEPQIFRYPPRDEWPAICLRPLMDRDELEHTVDRILGDVRADGDEALFKLTRDLDHVSLTSIKVGPEEFEGVEKRVPMELQHAILLARDHISRLHES